jgi:uncharacterized protein
MNPIRIDVRPILDETGASIDVSDSFDLGVLSVGANDFVLREPAHFTVSVTNAGAGIVAHGRIAADVTAACSRCLREYPSRIEGDVVGFFMRAGDAPPTEESADEADVVGADGSIDLGPSLLAALVVEAPFAPVHDDACKGLCTTCGEDLNLGPCSCSDESDQTHPFATLKDLRLDDSEMT